MRVLMLGWEFPPYIAGGLGVACYGLTKALDRMGHEVLFVLPKAVDRSHSSHVRMLSPDMLSRPGVGASPESDLVELAMNIQPEDETALDPSGTPVYAFQRTSFTAIPAGFSSPYAGGRPVDGSRTAALTRLQSEILSAAERMELEKVVAGATLDDAVAAHPAQAHTASIPESRGTIGGGAGIAYEGLDLLQETERYARLAVALTRKSDYDVIHAHDWLTYPAGLALKAVSRKPLVVHVHSTEFDRSGNNVNQKVYEIERAGMQGADRVIAVSQLTKSICVRRYGVSPGKVDVVYNGIEREIQQPVASAIESTDQIVLFLGRITMQKGPEYFIAAAQRVLEILPDVKFVLAGSGDMALRMIELAANMGIGHKVLFTGFLRGKDVEKVYRMADCYVMPSVSEPFGLAALEAINHNVPVILSKTSGASEVLQHVLKVDFWDIDEMANKIVAVLRHPPLSDTLKEHGSFELHRLTWEGAAERCIRSYQGASAVKHAVA